MLRVPNPLLKATCFPCAVPRDPPARFFLQPRRGRPPCLPFFYSCIKRAETKIKRAGTGACPYGFAKIRAGYHCLHMQTPSIIVYVYAALVGAGGLFGYLKAKSLPSLLAGEMSFLLLLAAGYALGTGKAWGCRWRLACRCFSWSFSACATSKAVPAHSCQAA